MSDIPGRILRTALLCGALGLALYGALTYAVTWPGFAPTLALLLTASLGAITAKLVSDGWRTGVFPSKFSVTVRAERPVAYWITMVWYCACLVGLLAVALLALLMLAEIWFGGTGENVVLRGPVRPIAGIAVAAAA
ncbi:MAG: hypothetical protein DCC74_11380 [Proteobacteria bacterium]|nr:MAG: hypothetical protein DCC74_11380 [Pseudomonadota bacterium]